ncbi:MAG: WD40 repeat domain-containing protein [Isosphaeraceae bacterium]
MSAEPEKAHVSAEFVHKAPLIACRFDRKNPHVFASAEDGSVQRWDLNATEPAKAAPVPYLGHESWVFALAPHPDGQTVLTGGGDGKLIWWSASSEKPEPARVVEAHAGWVRSIALSPDGQTVATCGNDRIVRLWAFADGAPLMELPGHDRPVYRLMFTPDGRSLISADLLGRVIVWDHRPGKEGRRLDAGKLYKYEGGQGVDYGGVRDLALSPDGTYLACAGLVEASNPLGAVSNPAILIFDWRTGQEFKLIRPKDDSKGVMWGLRYHPDGFLIGASGGTSGGRLWFFKPEGPNEFHKFALPNTARDLDLHHDGLRLATAHHDGKLRVTTLAPKPA